MTDNGTSSSTARTRHCLQLHRSPGVFFERVAAQAITWQDHSVRGSWVEFEYDTKNILYVRIDRKRKFYGSVFLRAWIETDEAILRAFYRVSKITSRIRKSSGTSTKGLPASSSPMHLHKVEKR